MMWSERAELARVVAKNMHYGMTYKSNEPNTMFTKHLMPVADLVYTYCNMEDMYIAGLLHDIVEDTPVTVDMVKVLFGDQVADIVWRVTDEPGANRKEKKLATYLKIAGHRLATLVKLCDRKINITGGDDHKREMYAREHPEFREHLYVPGMWNSLWRHLDKELNFKVAA